MGGPLFWATVFALVGVWAVLLGIPALRRPPPGFEPKLCPTCNKNSRYDATECEHCGVSLKEEKKEESGGPRKGAATGEDESA
ncbi:MAG: hypothetical protein WAO55_12860 [Candidatus Manganitrophaceae bacterium]